MKPYQCLLLLIYAAPAADAVYLHGGSRDRSGALAPPKHPPLRRIFYINLAESLERRRRMDDNLAGTSAGLPFERWPAVAAAGLHSHYEYQAMLEGRGVAPYFSLAKHRTRRGGALACYVSHATLLQHISTLSEEPALYEGRADDLYLVIEDDVTVMDGWRRRLEQVWQRVPKDWDLLKIGYWGTQWACDEVSPGIFAARLPGKASRRAGCLQNYLGTQAYVVSPRGAARALQHLASHQVRDLDTLLCSGLLCSTQGKLENTTSPDLKVYALSALRPYFTENASLQSSIGLDRFNTSCEGAVVKSTTCRRPRVRKEAPSTRGADLKD